MGRALRPLLALLALASAAGSLAGCEIAKTSKEGESPLKVLHANGESFVPAHASAVVTLEPEELDDVLAFGVKPIGTVTSGNGRLPDYLSRLDAGVKLVGPPWDVDLKKIEALDPDLIMGSRHRQGSLYKRLRAITYAVTIEESGRDWKLNLRLVGESLGRPDAGERLLDDYDARAERVRRRLPAARGTKVSLVRTQRDGVRAFSRHSFAGSIVGDLGFSQPGAQNSDRTSVTISPARIPSLDADYIFLGRAPGDASVYRRLTADPRWKRLRAVRAGHVVMVPDDVWFVGQGVLASRLVLRDLQHALSR
jgi:iron complex transport system substrate-binding protein